MVLTAQLLSLAFLGVSGVPAIPEGVPEGQLKPRMLSVSEVQSSTVVEVNTLLMKGVEEEEEVEERARELVEGAPILHLPLGTNKEKAPVKALVRMPGTKWCGIGWRTDTVMQFGGYARLDRCCRHHDLACPISIDPGETKHGLKNFRYHTVMHCSCDDRFRSCLKMADSQAADIVGTAFFNIGNTHCFVFKMESVCLRSNWWGQCIKTKRRPAAVWRDPVAY